MKKYKIIAHRGYKEKYPENTLLAFQKAFEYGADGIECDVQKTRDGRYVIFHDNTIRRANCINEENIKDLTLVELKMCSLEDNQSIPELTELLSIIPDGQYLDLELKPETIILDDCPVICDYVLRYVKKKHLMVSANEPHLLTYFRKRGIVTGLIIEGKCYKLGIWATLKMIFQFNPSYINLPVETFQVIGEKRAWWLIRFLQFCGKKIAFWTVNKAEDLTRIKNTTRLVITDRVEFIKKL